MSTLEILLSIALAASLILLYRSNRLRKVKEESNSFLFTKNSNFITEAEILQAKISLYKIILENKSLKDFLKEVNSLTQAAASDNETIEIMKIYFVRCLKKLNMNRLLDLLYGLKEIDYSYLRWFSAKTAFISALVENNSDLFGKAYAISIIKGDCSEAKVLLDVFSDMNKSMAIQHLEIAKKDLQKYYKGHSVRYQDLKHLDYILASIKKIESDINLLTGAAKGSV